MRRCGRQGLWTAVLAAVLWLASSALAQPVLRDVVITTVGALPSCAAGLKGRPYYVTDGATATDCLTGSGSAVVQCICDGTSYQGVSITGGGGGGSAVVLDLADDGANESSDLSEVAVTGDTNSIFTEPIADKLLIAVGNNWPTCDLANTGDSALNFFSTGTFENARISESSVTQHEAALTITEAQVSDLQTYLLNIVEDATPQLGGELDAQGSGIVGLGDVTFRSGASGGTLRTGTSAADLFKLQAYDTNGGTYRDMLELDAGVVPLMSLFHVTELDIDNGGAIRTGTGVGETALIQARDVDGAAWTTFATLTANNTPTFDLASSTTIGGALACLADASNCPALSAFSGAVTDDQVPDTITIDLAATATALAANGANCTAGNYPLGVDAAGAAESCTADDTGTDDQTAVEVPYTPTTGTDWVDPDPTEAGGALDDLAGRLTVEEAKADDDVPEAGDYSNLTGGTAITNSPTGTVNLDTTAGVAITGDWDFGGGGIEIENGITPPACTVGQLFLDTDATSGQQLLACEGGTFVLQGDGGGGGGDSLEVEDGDDAGTFSAVDTTAQLEDSGDINFVLTDGGAGGPDTVAGFVRSLDQEADGVPELSHDGTDAWLFDPDGDGSYDLAIREAGALTRIMSTTAADTGFIINNANNATEALQMYVSGTKRFELRPVGAVQWNVGYSFGISGDPVPILYANETHIEGAQINKPSSQTCTDSGDANPGALTLTVDGVSKIHLTNSDANGCTVTVGETGAKNGQPLTIVIVANAGGTVDFADTPGVTEIAGAFNASIWDSLVLDYTVDRWVQLDRSNN